VVALACLLRRLRASWCCRVVPFASGFQLAYSSMASALLQVIRLCPRLGLAAGMLFVAHGLGSANVMDVIYVVVRG